jgi:hypothetical protein
MPLQAGNDSADRRLTAANVVRYCDVEFECLMTDVLVLANQV